MESREGLVPLLRMRLGWSVTSKSMQEDKDEDKDDFILDKTLTLTKKKLQYNTVIVDKKYKREQ